jgi:hypothetical protein
VKDWSVQGISELYNGLNTMSTDGKSVAALKGTTYVRMDGSAPANPNEGMVPWTMPSPKGGKPMMMYRPGAAAYEGGTMGYRTQLGEGQDMIVLFDAAQKMPNADEAAGISMAEGTFVHESGHAVQLGGKVGASDAQRLAQEQKLVKEWSALADWRERDGSLADGYYGQGDSLRRFYKDPGVSVGHRASVVSDYGATDTVEDFAEFTRTFFNDPVAAMELSPEKFLYMNQMYENHYTPSQVNAVASTTGVGMQGLQRALESLRGKLKLAA